MPRLSQQTKILKDKSVSSLRAAMNAFNTTNEDGRATQVLLSLQHAFEMLLKASLTHYRVAVFDKTIGRSIGIDTCIGKAQGHAQIQLTPEDAGTIRAIDAMRDDEQHWFNLVSEQLLYLHARAGVTLFDDLLQKVFNDHLANHLPNRVLPISAEPPQDLQILLDEEYSAIKKLLAPGRRQRHDARARIRTLLAMEAHRAPDAKVSVKDVDRVEKAIRSGSRRSDAFPSLSDLSARIDGAGALVTVHFTKKQGAPVTFVSDPSAPAAGVREVDLQRKFHLSSDDLARALALTSPKATALRRHLGTDTDRKLMHVFEFGQSRHPRYSDFALTSLQRALDQIDLARVWDGHRTRKGGEVPKSDCGQPDCMYGVGQPTVRQV